MPLLEVQLTLGAAATQLSAGSARGATLGRVSIRHAKFSPAAHTYYIGNSIVDSTHGIPVASSAVNTNLTTTDLGAFSGDAPVDSNEIYISGTQNDVVQILLMTQ